jgi:hypothetical protein
MNTGPPMAEVERCEPPELNNWGFATLNPSLKSRRGTALAFMHSVLHEMAVTSL